MASSPQTIAKNSYRIACPLDPFASGTWIAVSDFGDVVCLLNGAFSAHQRRLPYRMSRGQVVIDYFETGNPEQFNQDYDLDRIEPFTLVIVKGTKSPSLFELRWDGKAKHFRKLDTEQIQLWSSVTLYRDEIAKKKEEAFLRFLKNQKSMTPETLMDCHQNFLYQDWVHPPERVEVVSTLSITSVRPTGKSMEMRYRDLVRKESELELIELPVSRKH